MTIRGMNVLHPKNVAIGSAPTASSKPQNAQKMPFARSVLRSRLLPELLEATGLVAIIENLSIQRLM